MAFLPFIDRVEFREINDYFPDKILIHLTNDELKQSIKKQIILKSTIDI